MAANLNALTSAPIVTSPSPEADAAGNWAPGAQAPVTEASFVWGEDPTDCSRYIIIETTISGTSYQAPRPGMPVSHKKLCNIWPGQIYWTETKKDANSFRLFARLNAMTLNRSEDGVPILNEDGDLTFSEGIQVYLCKKGLSQQAQANITGLEAARATAKPEMVPTIDKLLAEEKAKTGWMKQKLDSRSFVANLAGTGEALVPVTMYLNFAFSIKQSADFNRAVAKLNSKGEAGLLRFYVPIEQLSMPKSKWEVVKAKINKTTTIDLKHPVTGKLISGPVFSWGNAEQPISKVEIIPGKCLPSAKNMDRMLSVKETDRRVAGMEREWNTSEETEIRNWAEALKGRFSSEGNKWAHKAGALPKLNGGIYGTTCEFWQETAEDKAKFQYWCEMLRSLVGDKPRLHEENLTGSKLFLAETCEAIIAAGATQSIKPWMDYLATIGKGTTTVSVVSVPSVAPTTPVVNSIEPEVKAIEESTPVAQTSEEEPSEDEITAAIFANRMNLDELADEPDLTGDFFQNYQE
jgi:hypothetical protein